MGVYVKNEDGEGVTYFFVSVVLVSFASFTFTFGLEENYVEPFQSKHGMAFFSASSSQYTIMSFVWAMAVSG